MRAQRAALLVLASVSLPAYSCAVEDGVVKINGYTGSTLQEEGTGFLFDRRGYFVTNAHVIRKGTGTTKDHYTGKITASFVRSGQVIEVPLEVASERGRPGVPVDLCDDITGNNICRKGADLALLRIKKSASYGDPQWTTHLSQLCLLDVAFYSSLKFDRTLRAEFHGYKEKSNSMLSPPSGTLHRMTTADMQSRLTRDASDTSVGFVVGGFSIDPGQSGSPGFVLPDPNRKDLGPFVERISALLTLQGTGTVNESFAIDASRIRDLAEHIGLPQEVKDLAEAGTKITGDDFKRRTQALTNQELVWFQPYLKGKVKSNLTDAQVEVLKYLMVERQLYREIVALQYRDSGEAGLPLNTGISQSAISFGIRIALDAQARGDVSTAKGYLSTTQVLIDRHVAKIDSANDATSEVEIARVNALALDAMTTASLLGDAEAARAWGLTVFKTSDGPIGRATGAQTVGDTYLASGDYPAAMYYYGLSHQNDRNREAVTKGFKDARARLKETGLAPEYGPVANRVGRLDIRRAPNVLQSIVSQKEAASMGYAPSVTALCEAMECRRPRI